MTSLCAEPVPVAEILFRPIRPDDEARLARFHEALSEESVYFRYAGTLALAQRIAHARLAERCRVDGRHDVVLVAEVREQQKTPEIVAVGRLASEADEGEAELGLIVLDRYQHQGLGTEMLMRLLETGASMGFRGITASMFTANGAMRHVCEKLGFKVEQVEGEPEMLRAHRSLGAGPAHPRS